jgi:Zn-dependent peptidase ImmA (M78 family)
MLIPESQLKEAFELKSMVRLVQYKERFGISLAAMIYRAKRSRLISSTLYQRLWRDFGRLGYNKIEPGYVAPDRPRRMEALIDAAVSQNIISYQEVARIVGTNEESVTDRIFRAMGGNPSSRDNKDPSIINFQQLKHDYDN